MDDTPPKEKPKGPPPSIQLDVKRIQEHIQKRWGPVSCQMCHQGKWAVGDKVFELREFCHGAIKIGKGPIIPVIPIVCTNCGRTVLINAVTIGLINGEKKEGNDD